MIRSAQRKDSLRRGQEHREAPAPLLNLEREEHVSRPAEMIAVA